MFQSSSPVSTQQQAEGLLDFGALFRGKACAFEADEIERCELILSVRHAVGGDVLADRSIALDDGVIADVDELVKRGSSTEKTAIADANVAGEQNIVCQHIVIADLDIVSEVHACHQKIVVADASNAAAFRASMDGDIFAQSIVFTDDHARIRAGIKVQVLRVGANDRAPTDAIVCGNGDISLDQDMACDVAVIADDNRAVNDRKRADANMFADLRLGRDQCCGMNE